MRQEVAIVVIAKEPRAGHSKTRLCPPCTPHEAARVAMAALTDTLECVRRSDHCRRVIALEGSADHPIFKGLATIDQRGRDLDERLAAAFEDVGGPAFLIGMDTPQVTHELLEQGSRWLMQEGVDAVIGPTEDGGYWGIGLRCADPRVFIGVPMSTELTFDAQVERLRSLGLATRVLPRLRDIDRYEDARAVADMIPTSRTAAVVRSLGVKVPGS